jgi:hypothetical protein
MSLNKKIGFLLDNGFTPNFVSNLNENKISLLYEKMSKKETKEETKTQVTNITFDPSNPTDQQKLAQKGVHVDPSTKKITMTTSSSGAITEDDEEIEQDPYGDYKDSQKLQQRGPSDYGDNPELDKEMDDYDADGMGIMEKFESKAQQGLFWVRCNKCKSENCKWCKMAKEFSKSTSKKQYKAMPEKKHPEKTVKYKKKETKENFTFKDYLGKLGSAYTAEMAKKVKGTTPIFSESIFEKNLENIIEENLKPTMKKRDLLKLIESEIKNKKGLNEDFYMKDIYEDSDVETAPIVKPSTPETKPGKPKRKFDPEEEPMNPDEGEESEPQADLEIQKLLKKLKSDFDKGMKSMDDSTHKSINYRKF